MQQRTRRLAMFMGGSFLAALGLVAAACGTDNGDDTTAIPVDSGARRDTGTTPKDGGTEPDPDDEDGSTTPLTDAGADCGKIATVQSSIGVYCPFAFEKDSGTGPNCDSSKKQVCCNGQKLPADAGFAPTKCDEATPASVGYEDSTACESAPNTERFDCMEQKHCPNAADVCCAIGADGGSLSGFPPPKNACSRYEVFDSRVSGTRCKSACDTGNLTLCGSDADCKTGKCMPLELANRFGGYCKL